MVFGPSNTSAEMEATDNLIRSTLQAAAAKQEEIAPAIRGPFSAFVQEWKKFREENSGLVARSLNATWAQVQDFKHRANYWREKMLSAGVDIAAPALPEEEGFPWLKVAFAAGAVAGAVWFLSDVFARKQSSTPARRRRR